MIALKDKLLRPFLAAIPVWITPNGITAGRMLLVLPLVLALLDGWFSTATILLLLILFLDLIDGPLARLRKQITRAGSLLDPLADKLAIAAIILILGTLLLPLNILLTIIVLEIVTVMGATTTLAFNTWLPRGIDTSANVFGKYKMACYGLGSITLTMSIYSDSALSASTFLFSIGALLSIASLVWFGISLPPYESKK